MDSTVVKRMTSEEAVQWLIDQPDQKFLVDACYFDSPAGAAAERYANSGEWLAVSRYLPKTCGRALDIGAGRGISSYALARMGWQVTALEPDPSELIGSGAIRTIMRETGVKIDIISEVGRDLEFEDETFDLVFGRQVLHHLPDLKHGIKECYRVLKKGGTFVAMREHVLSKPDDLDAFLQSHPLHHLHGLEHAYILSEYIAAIVEAGFVLQKTLGSFDDVMNYFPAPEEQLDRMRLDVLTQKYGEQKANLAMSLPSLFKPMVREYANKLLTAHDNTPGRLYSFIAVKR